MVRSGLAVLLVSAATGSLCGFEDFPCVIDWQQPTEIVRGGGHRGEWRGNESDYDYVDDPAVALDGNGAAVVAWVNQRQKDVLLQRYDVAGKPQFTKPVNVSRTPAVFSWLPRVVLSPTQSKAVFVLWQEIIFSGGTHGGDILFTRSIDGGATFSEAVNLSNSKAGDGKGRISKNGWHNGSLDLVLTRDGVLVAAWTEYEGPLWVSRSEDGGATFSKPERVAGGGEAKPARAPALAVSRDNVVYVAWTLGEDNAADIRVASSHDNGRTFSEPTVVAQTKGYSDAPKLVVGKDRTVHLVHAESFGGPADPSRVVYTRSRDQGRTFERERELSRTPQSGAASAGFPALGLDDSDNLYVLWDVHPHWPEHARGLAISCSCDTGMTFSEPTMVPGSSDPAGGLNGSFQGFMRKLAVNGSGAVAVVNSSLKSDEKSRAWLIRGQLRK
jgi:hypothetical protein